MKIIKIGAVWCPGCLVMKKVWNKITHDYPNLDIKEYDLDLDALDVKKYNVGSILPVIIFMDNDQELDRLIGEQTYEKICEYIDKYRSKI